ncbi:MAG TPA: cysteine desulfurase NifS [Firmicutes bacterium]|mgnify:FL=1|jgi:cysteine desulfurase|nr:cysteine desulfurase NifS [Bacillota bacterium]
MIYFDHAATTPVKPEVLEAMLPYFSEKYGNASSVYKLAQENKKAIDNARRVVAQLLGAQPNEIFFTSGGTESDNWALRGIASSLKEKGNHLITTKIEHHAVLHTCQYLESQGFEVTYLDVDENGLVTAEQVAKAIKTDTILISIIYANNEIGTIMPIAEIGKVAKEHGVIFHTDAVQAVGQIPIDVNRQHIDLLSLSGHKFYGPKGIGALYLRRGIKIPSLLHGGGQERGRRAGTENVPGIVGLATAMDLAYQNLERKNTKIKALRDQLINGIYKRIPFCRLNGHREQRLPNNVNFSFDFIEGESLLLLLDFEGIAASSGSACTSGSLDPSHVLLALGLPHEQAHGSIRFTLGEDNTREEVDLLLEKLPPFVQKLRAMSPLYEDFLRKHS